MATLTHRGLFWTRAASAVLLSVVLFLRAAAALPAAEQPKHTAAQVQAAYLYNFGRFVEWPATAAWTKGSAFTICVFGQDPFGPILLTTIAGGSIGGKAVVTKRISDPAQAAACQILFISSSEEARLGAILEALNKAAVVTVSDMPQFMARGGMIQFVLEGNKVRFEVDLAAARSAGLTLSSELLKVAAAVKGTPGS